MSKLITIACKGSILLSIQELNEFQGELKSLSVVNFERLKREIIEHGFSFTIHVWYDQKSKKHFILDGHQRKRVLLQMIKDGWECPPIPCSEVFADSYKQAKRKLLAAALSQYGKVQEDGLMEYLQETDITPEELVSRYDSSDIDLIRFVESNFEGLSQSDMDTLDESAQADKDEEEHKHTCPKCSFEF